MKRATITFEAYEAWVHVINTLESMGLFPKKSWSTSWEQRPKMRISRRGTLEAIDRSAIYGLTVEISFDDWLEIDFDKIKHYKVYWDIVDVISRFTSEDRK